MAKAETVCCFVATVGPALEIEVQKQMQQRRYADAYVLDAMGSMSAENVVEQFYQRTARRLAKENKGVTLRFSPGYCDWPVTEQKKLFSLIASQDVDVELNDSCLMTPRKSISGVFGIHSNGETPYNPCWDCGRTECPARRAPMKERKKA